MKELLEKDIQKQILDYLRFRGIFCWKNTTVGVYVRARDTYIPSHAVGVADILGVLPGGRILCIEVKRSSGTVSLAQQAFLGNVNENGGLAFVATSVEDVQCRLEPAKRIKAEPGKAYKISATLAGDADQAKV